MIASSSQRSARIAKGFAQVIHRWVKPNNLSLLLEAALDLTRSKPQLILKNAFLRQPLIVRNRRVIKAHVTERMSFFGHYRLEPPLVS